MTPKASTTPTRGLNDRDPAGHRHQVVRELLGRTVVSVAGHEGNQFIARFTSAQLILVIPQAGARLTSCREEGEKTRVRAYLEFAEVMVIPGHRQAWTSARADHGEWGTQAARHPPRTSEGAERAPSSKPD